MSWKRKLEEVLRSGMPYCFPCIEGKYQEINEEEFSGGDFGGFLGFITTRFNTFRKKCFVDGYRAGVLDAISDLEQKFADEITIVSSDIGADRAWDKYELENK